MDYLYENDIRCEILGLDRATPKIDLAKYADKLNIRFSVIDLMDREALKSTGSHD